MNDPQVGRVTDSTQVDPPKKAGGEPSDTSTAPTHLSPTSQPEHLKDLIPKKRFRRVKAALKNAAATALVILILLAVYNSIEASTPGDLLYPVEKEVEQVRRQLTQDPESQADFEIGVLEERYEELNDIQNDMVRYDENAAEGREDNIIDTVRDAIPIWDEGDSFGDIVRKIIPVFPDENDEIAEDVSPDEDKDDDEPDEPDGPDGPFVPDDDPDEPPDQPDEPDEDPDEPPGEPDDPDEDPDEPPEDPDEPDPDEPDEDPDEPPDEPDPDEPPDEPGPPPECTGKVTICHKGKTQEVNCNALDKRLEQGATLGSCEDEHTEKIKDSLEEIDIQEEVVVQEVEELDQAVEQGLVEVEVSTRIAEKIQKQVEKHMDIMERVEEKLVERGNIQAAQSVHEAGEHYYEVKTNKIEELEETGGFELIEVEEGVPEEGIIIEEEPIKEDKTPPGKDKKDDDDTDEEEEEIDTEEETNTDDLEEVEDDVD